MLIYLVVQSSKANNSPEFYDASNANDIELGQVRDLLRRARLRATAPRLAVLRTLARERRPLSHAEIAHTLHAGGFDRVTVFRNLQDLAEAAILSRVDVGDHTWRFELRSGDNLSGTHHSHFVCERCCSVSCLDDFSPSALPQTSASGAIIASVSQVVLRGYCRLC
jgi:Fur family transcriptional regulator, ferric uptake regulator